MLEMQLLYAFSIVFEQLVPGYIARLTVFKETKMEKLLVLVFYFFL